MTKVDTNSTKITHKLLTGSRMIVEALKEERVEVIFGYPGGAVLNIYDAIYDGGIPHLLTRHEQGAIHAAEGYARITGKPGVVVATSGPGATNIVTGLADAMMDSLPLVVFTGQVNSHVLGSDAFQEAPTLGISMPITKHNFQVQDVKDLPRIIKEAFYIATTGRPGPVLIDIPKDVTAVSGVFDYSKEVHLPGYKLKLDPDPQAVKSVAHAIKKAKKPVILAGAGILHSHASDELKELVAKTTIPVASTLLGLGSFPSDHPLFLGMAGMHGTYTANMALYESDLIINIGARFDDRLTGNLQDFAKHAQVVHFDIDPSEIGKNVPTDFPVIGDAAKSLQLLLSGHLEKGDIGGWLEKLFQLKEEYPLWYVEDGETLKPQKLIELLHDLTKGEAIISTDVGQHQMWAAQFHGFQHPNKWVTSGGLGTMGFGLPAAIGAQIADKKAVVVAVLGDAGFQMTLQELAVLTEYRLPVKVVLVNNQSMGMVRQWQQLFYKERYSESLLTNQPDYVKLSDAFGIKAALVKNEDEFKTAFAMALENDEPFLLDCRVTHMENVYPMIAPGKGIQQMEGVKP
ncbi:biosynthetic-type acetolactate synthase large subunit [Sutcliffiella rhizosphaerae]|uniref:Acetolactate synthase n=1 Tax=Sutcliffiella rhizosphaerae TaxID=2880967 RepID=A0ABM8YL66_9BACI|nr:biosynthetic-type acetolactate synthase large subunit [Sutcliffiella rhizosphaerae]CAG9620672.1 Acetolactate synthase large subunit [Sutcliffiella rhizosphaerae]